MKKWNASKKESDTKEIEQNLLKLNNKVSLKGLKLGIIFSSNIRDQGLMIWCYLRGFVNECI